MTSTSIWKRCLKPSGSTITRAEAQRLVNDFNEYLETLSEAQRVNRYGPQQATLSSYERCRHCGSVAEVRPTKPEDGTPGKPIGPIINATPEAAGSSNPNSVA